MHSRKLCQSRGSRFHQGYNRAMDTIVSAVLGTAGHIDHGKSSLVKRLTGKDPDRLAEEQAREMTIDLGFAPYRLPDGRTLGIIDVPGHERFVKNMVAGATGVDVVLLVVAADDGVMPQTREHLEILTLLGISHGLIALTKIDMPGVDADLLELLELELDELLAGTFLEGAPVLRVSSITGDGFEALEQAIAAAIAQVPPRSTAGAFRMPVQRVFSAKGFGTVLTGVPLEGTAQAGDKVEVLTQDGKTLPGKIRGLQAYGQSVDRVRAGHSSALNVSDVDRKTVHRGDVVCTPGIFQPSTLWEARLTYLPSQVQPLRQRETVRLHVGTAEVLGEVVLLEHKALAPGETGLIQLRLREHVVAAAGDAFVIRRHSPMVTIGGGQILGASRWRLKPFKGFVLDRLGQKAEALGSAEQRLVVELDQARDPARLEALIPLLEMPRKEAQAVVDQLLEHGQLIESSGGKGQPSYVTAARFEAAKDHLLQVLAAWHDEHPFRSACPRLTLRSQAKLHEGLFNTALQALEDAHDVRRDPGQGDPARRDQDAYARDEHQRQLTEPAQTYQDALLELYDRTAYQPPTPTQALEELTPELSPTDAQDVYEDLLHQGLLVSLGDDIVFAQPRYEAAKQLVIDTITAHGPLTAATVKEALDSSRRYTIPLLEHFDEIGLTRREGNHRVLR